jgi:hypothetical protein
MAPAVQRQEEEEELQMAPAVQRQEEEEELQMAPAVQRQEEEEELQMAPAVQRQEEEEELQMAPAVQRQEEEEELQMAPAVQRQEEVQTKPVPRDRSDGGFRASTSLEQRLAAQRGSGGALPNGTRSFMESRFGASFGDVRVHTGSEAAGLNKDLRSKAFTHGKDIYFGTGKFDPGTGAGKRLLAHELTHVVQQSGRDDRIARWGGMAENATGHDEVTADAFERIRDPKTGKTGYSQGAQEYVKHHSESMDLRLGFLLMVGGAQGYQKMFSRMAKDKDAYDNMSGYWRRPDEAPNHAEAGRYRSTGGGKEDLERVKLNVQKAIAAWNRNNPSQALSMLGLAVHTAEDRGAHGDGAPGTGHDPRRSIKPPRGAKMAHLYEGEDWKGSDCDSKEKNPAGYAFSVGEAVKVLTEFRDSPNRKRKTKLGEYKKPGGLSTAWRSGKILFGSGHTNLTWENWKGKTGLAKKAGSVALAPAMLSMLYGAKGGWSGLKMGHRTAKQIWRGRVGGSGGLGGRIKRGWKRFGKRVSGAFGGYTERMGERFARSRRQYRREMLEAKLTKGGHKRRWKKLLAMSKLGIKGLGRGLQAGLGYLRRGVTTGLGALLGAGATAVGGGLGALGSLLAYGGLGGLGLAGGLTGGALRGVFEYTGRPVWALGKPIRALAGKMRGRESGKGYEGRGLTLIKTAKSVGLNAKQTMAMVRLGDFSKHSVDLAVRLRLNDKQMVNWFGDEKEGEGPWSRALATALERLDGHQRKAIKKLTPDNLGLLKQLDADTVGQLHKLAPEKIAQIGPGTINNVRGWFKTQKEEDTPYESLMSFGFNVPQITALGRFNPKQMTALVEGLEGMGQQLDAFKKLEPTQLKALARLDEGRLSAFCQAYSSFNEDQLQAFAKLEAGKMGALARFKADDIKWFHELSAKRISRLGPNKVRSTRRLLKKIRGKR